MPCGAREPEPGEWLDGRLRDRNPPCRSGGAGGEDPALGGAARRILRRSPLLAELDWDQVLAEVGGKRRGSMGRCGQPAPVAGEQPVFFLRS